MAVVQYKSEADDELYFSRWSDPDLCITNFGRNARICRNERGTLTAFTSRPVKPFEIFRIKILDVNLEMKKNLSFSIGLTSSIKSDDKLNAQCKLEVSEKYVDLFCQNTRVQRRVADSRLMTVQGSVYSVVNDGRDVTAFAVNGTRVGDVKVPSTEDLYGFCTLNSFVKEVSIDYP